jgi:hypothetical protein
MNSSGICFILFVINQRDAQQNNDPEKNLNPLKKTNDIDLTDFNRDLNSDFQCFGDLLTEMRV